MYSVNLIHDNGIYKVEAMSYGDLLDQLIKRLKEIKQTNKPKKNRFSPYLSLKEVTEGLKTGELIKGTIKIDRKNYQRAYIANEPDYIITSCMDRNRALDGDVVVVRLKPENEWFKKQKTTVVVYVLKRKNPRVAIGFLEDTVDGNFVVLVSRDRRLPNVRIPTRNVPAEYKNVLFKANINHWKSMKYAIGSIVEPIGTGGDLKVEVNAILAGHNINLGYFVDDSAFLVMEEESAGFVECSKHVFTVDSNLELAISCKERGNGNFEVAVYVADVARYLKEDSALDGVVFKRGHTIRLFDDVHHMLSIELRRRCSFTTGDDRSAFVVSWEITKEGSVISTNFKRTIIRTYGHVTTYIPIVNDNLNESINNLIKVSLEPNLKCAMDKFINLANVAVAKEIVRAVPEQAILYREDAPNRHMLEKLEDLLSKYKIGLDTSSSSALDNSIANVTNWELGFCLKYMVSTLTRRGYYYIGGTNSIPYTHFTSPFNRYMDIVIQRLLEMSLEHSAKRQWKAHYLDNIVEHCNQQLTVKFNMEREIDNLCFVYGIEEEHPYDAAVIGIGNNYLDVVLLETRSGLRIYPKKFRSDVKYLIKLVDEMEDKLSIIFGETDVFPEEKCMFRMFSVFQVNLLRFNRSMTVEARILRPVNVRDII